MNNKDNSKKSSKEKKNPCKGCFYDGNCPLDKSICRYLNPEKFTHEGVYVKNNED